MRLVSYNVHGCVGRDGRRDPERVARVLRELDAAVVGLQEVDSRPGTASASLQLDHLAQSAGYAAIPGPTIVAHDRSYGNALLVRSPVQDTRRHDISVPGREPRGVLEVRLEVEGRPLRVLVTHFGLRARERADQARRVVELLASPRAGVTLVLMGDLNQWFPWGGAIGRIHRRLGRAPAPPTFPACLPLLALDRVWVVPRPPGARGWVVREGAAATASDHLPLVVDLPDPG